jgi:hypothetical protein
VDTTPLVAALHELRPLEIRQVRRSPDEGLFNGLLAQYHYLGYREHSRFVRKKWTKGWEFRSVRVRRRHPWANARGISSGTASRLTNWT